MTMVFLFYQALYDHAFYMPPMSKLHKCTCRFLHRLALLGNNDYFGVDISNRRDIMTSMKEGGFRRGVYRILHEL